MKKALYIVKRKYFVLIGLFCLLTYPINDALPQVDEQASISSTPNPLGSGARALGMGNAFIAVADDATAASWNPGGLMQLDTPEVSMVLYNASRTEDYTFMAHPEADSSERTNEFNINYLSAAYPFAVFGRNMVVSLNYQRLYDMNKELKFNLRTSTSVFDITERINYKAEGGIKALSPAYAIQITEDISFGFTLNFYMDAMGGRNGWKDEYRSQVSGSFNGIPFTSQIDYSHEYERARGFNFNLGVLWSINEIITFGAVFKGPLELKMRHTHISKIRNFGMETPTKFIREDKKELSLPLSYGAGLAFRFSDALTIAFDVHRTEWGQYFFTSDDGSRTSPIDGRPRSESHINATTQVHVGAEYQFALEKTVIPVRGGVFYDPEPSEGFSEDFYGFAFGAGISIGDVVLDAAYQYRWGRDSENRGIPGTEADVDHHTLYMSVMYHF